MLNDAAVNVDHLVHQTGNLCELIVREHTLILGVIDVPEPLEVLATEDAQGDQLVLAREAIVIVQHPIGIREVLAHVLADDVIVPADDWNHIVRGKQDDIRIQSAQHLDVGVACFDLALG